MPVANIVDSRTNRYNVLVSVVFEYSWQDNSVEGASYFVEGDEGSYLCCYVEETTIAYAIWYVNQEYPDEAVTIYLYDVGASGYRDHDTIELKNGAFVLSGKT